MPRVFRTLPMIAFLWALLPEPGRPLSILLPIDRGVPPLTLVRQDQSVVISDQVARTTLHQVFHNPTHRTLEALYLFPVPKGAQVTDFSMIINGARVHGEVLESGKARKTYEDIVRRMRDPGLIEYMDDALLRVRVYPIPARGDQAIDLELTQTLPKEGGLVRYEFPFGAEPGRTGLPTKMKTVSLSIKIRSDQPLSTIYSPTHDIDIKKKDDNRSATIEVDRKDLRAGRDFVLYYGTTEKDVGANLVAYRPDPDKPGYFMLLLSPGEQKDGEEVIPKDVTFVLDTSGSMAHDGKLDQAKEALIQCIGALREGDRFNIVVFSNDVESMSGEFLPADAPSRTKAERYIKKLLPRGGTNIEGALETALKTKGEKGRLHVVVFMTDGQPTVGETVPKAILSDIERHNKAGLRIFPFGIGYDVNTKLLDGIADETRAAADYVKPKESIEQKVGTFFDKVSAPVLTNCTLDISGADAFDLYPQSLPDLFRGQQLMVFGRYRKSGSSAIRLEGKKRDKTVKLTFEAKFPNEEEKNGFIESLWGTRKIGFLLDEIRRNGESEELRDEVVRLAKKYNVVTPYTSYLVTEDEAAPVPLVQRRFRGPSRGVPNYQMGAAPTGAPGPYYSYSPGAAAGTAGIRSMGVPQSSAIEGRIGDKGALTLSMDSSSGQVAVDQSIALRQMKETESMGQVYSAGSPAETRREVAGRTFVLRDGVWTDENSLEKTDLPVVKIQFGSAAYFDLLTLRKDLKPVLQLGERLRIRLDKAILEVGPEGAAELGDQDKALLRK